MKKRHLNINLDIIERCRNGETDAQFFLYRQYSKAMYNLAIRFLNNRMDAEDILQESFITAFEKLPSLADPDSFGSWIKRIVINNCIDHLKKKKIDFDSIGIYFETEDPGESDLNSDPDPAIVHEGIRQLPDGSRIILSLHALEGYKHREIAQMLNISESTSKSQYRRALELLAVTLKNKIYAR